MSGLVVDLELISLKSKEDKDAFEQLRSKIKTIPVTQFDAIAHPIVEEITNKIDCTQCGNCCKQQEPGVTVEEMDALATIKNISVDEFKDRFVAWDREGVSFLCNKPCTFLNGTICSVYSSRPNSCADFPGLHRPRLKWRWKQVEENYGICPIVFNVVERLKEIV